MKAEVLHHDAMIQIASYPRVAATGATLIRKPKPSKSAPPEDKVRPHG